MNKKTQIVVAAALLLGLATLAIADLKTQQGPGTYNITDDSSNSANFTLRKSGDIGADKDTSDTYDTYQWNHIVLQVKGSPKLDGVTRAAATALDSGAATVYTQGSNDRVYWKDIDTTTAADSLAVSEEIWFKERLYRYLRWRVDAAAKTDDSGVTVNLKINASKR